MMATKSCLLVAIFLIPIASSISQVAQARWEVTETMVPWEVSNDMTSLSLGGQEACKPEDVYRYIKCWPTHNCICCQGNCKKYCERINSVLVNQKCTKRGQPGAGASLDCDCCCKNMSPPPSPSPPSPPPPPPSPPPPSPSPPPPANMCEPGDVYNWAFCNTPICDCCFSWCKNKCAGMGRSMTAQRCKKSENPNHTDCDCCCDKNMSPPSPPPPSPPPPSPPPPSPSPPPPANMCEPGDVYKSVVWGPTQDCTICTSWCKDQCTNMSSLVVGQTCGRTPPGSMNFRCDCCCKNMPPSPPPPSPSPPLPSPPPPPPSPPPPSSPPPSISPPPPPTPPINICRAGEEFIPNPVTDCSVCTSEYCRSQCSARGASLARLGCAPSLLSCKCCCKSLTLPSSTTALGSSLFAAIPDIMFH